MNSDPLDLGLLKSGHAFEPDPVDSYYCAHCKNPRALHENTGFTPSATPSTLPTDTDARYRGGHPHFYRP